MQPFTLLAALLALTSASLLQNSIYTTLQGTTTCTRLLDEFGEIGCTTPSSGSVGILYLVNDTASLASFRNATGVNYIALIPQQFLAVSTNGNSTIQALLTIKHLNGVLVYDNNFTSGSSVKFSADSLLPNQNQGLAFGATGRSVVNWNGVGGGYNRLSSNFSEGVHWQPNLPIFAYLSPTDQPAVFNCYNSFNQNLGTTSGTYQHCAARISSFMYGAENTDVCLRRGYCNPLGNLNLYGSTQPILASSNVVIISAQLDTLSFFHDLSFGTEADVSGIVALLAAAALLGDPANNASATLTNPILFAMFHGEAFGYIGSSRFSYDLINGNFPSSSAPISASNIKAYIELNQVAQQSNYHIYSIANSAVSSPIFSAINATSSSSSTFTDETATSDLPPASLRGILMNVPTSTFPGVVITDHPPSGFTNQFYHSRFDNSDNIAFTNASDVNSTVVQRLCTLAGNIIQAAWSLSNNGNTSLLVKKTADCQFVATLLNCLTQNSSCSLSQDTFGTVPNPNQPFSRYVSTVPSDVFTSDAATGFIRAVFAQAVAVDKNASNPSCKLTNVPNEYTFYQLNNKVCLKTATFAQIAMSPAFNAKGTALNANRDPRYSTTTESQWGSFQISIFRSSPSQQDLSTALGGLGYFIFVMLLTWWLARKANDGQRRRSEERP